MSHEITNESRQSVSHVLPEKPAHYSDSQVEQQGQRPLNGYRGGSNVDRFITPGGHPLDTSQAAFPVYHRKFADAAPLGLLATGTTLFVLAMYLVNVRDITTPNVILGMALSYGGLVLLIASVQEWASGNTLASTAFATYAGFWLSFGVVYIPQFGVTTAYTSAAELNSALGIYLISWGIVTFIFLLASLKSSAALVSVLFFLTITFFVIAAGYLQASPNVIKAGGAFGIITSVCCWYTALAGLMTPDTAYFTIPVGNLARAK